MGKLVMLFGLLAMLTLLPAPCWSTNTNRDLSYSPATSQQHTFQVYNSSSSGTAMADGRYHMVPPLIFSATGPKDPIMPNVGSYNAIIFYNSTDFNVGNGFNLQASVFLAPVPGFYSFNLAFNKIAKSNTDCRVFIFKNHNDLAASGYAGGPTVGTIDIFADIWLGTGGSVNTRYQGDCGAIPKGAHLSFEELLKRPSARFSGELLAVSSVPFPVICEQTGCAGQTGFEE